MRLRKTLLALTACLAVAAVTAGSASAQWMVEGSALSGSAEVNVSGGPFTLELKVGKAEFELTAQSVGCASTCTIDNESNNHSAGALEFTEITVSKPAGCTHPGAIATEALEDEVIAGSNGEPFDKFFPASGETFVTITFSGSCAFAGIPVPIKGTVTGEAAHGWGVEEEIQPLTFGAEQQTIGGGSLVAASNSATLIGTGINTLVAGGAFGATE